MTISNYSSKLGIPHCLYQEMSTLAMIQPKCDSSDYISILPCDIKHESTLKTCVIGNGKKLFLRKRHAPCDHDSKTSSSTNFIYGSLLGQPMSSLMKEAEKLQIYQKSQSLKKQQELQDKLDSELDISLDSFGVKESEPIVESLLWVDRYAPRMFSELLSPERTNREVLKALKQWDAYVFKTPVIATLQSNPPSKYGNSTKPGGFDHNRNNNFSKNKHSGSGLSGSNDRDVEDTSDANGDGDGKRKSIGVKSNNNADDPRPRYKVIVLSGPPGTGKTTLAHILAKHCGYRPYEVNASDDRSAEKLREIMQNCMASNTINISSDPSKQSKPNCVILDEIDGVDSRETIKMLIDIVKEPIHIKQTSSIDMDGDIDNKHNDADGNDHDDADHHDESAHMNSKKSSAATRKSSFPLTRPLICICNDLYSPILRDLRKYAMVFQFEPPTEVRLVQRLRQICNQEIFTHDHHSTHHVQPSISNAMLTQLCNAAGNDIRSVINTLQFAASMMKHHTSSSSALKHINQSILQSMMTSGLKDISQDIFQLWNMVFCTKEMNQYISKKSTNIASLALANAKMTFDLQSFPDYSNKHTTDDNSFGKSVSHENASYSSTTTRVSDIMDVMYQGHDDYDLVLSGCFHNHLRVPYSDPLLTKTALIGHWFSSIDVYQGVYKTSGDGYQLRKYVPLIVAALQLYNSHDSKTKLEFPHKDRSVAYEALQKNNVLKDFKERAYLTLCGSTYTPILAMDVVPAMLSILSPKVRPIPFLSLSPMEKSAIHDVVHVMVDYGIEMRKSHTPSYRNQDSNTSADALQFDPPIHDLVNSYDADKHATASSSASSSSFSGRHILSPIIREAIVYELKKAVVAKAIEHAAVEIVCHDHLNTMTSPSRPAAQPLPPAAVAIAAVYKVSDPLNVLLNPPLPMATGRMDFFFNKTSSTTKRASANISAAASTGSASKTSDEVHTKKQRILFRYNQGFSNAVRRPVAIQDFF